MKEYLLGYSFVGILLSLLANYAIAGCDVDISDYVGWEIIYSGTVTGYINESGEEEGDFEGCEFGRQLIVDYTNTVTCAEYSYSYAYHPDIVILSRSGSLKACIDNEMYDIRR